MLRGFIAIEPWSSYKGPFVIFIEQWWEFFTQFWRKPEQFGQVGRAPLI
jgi:hypothetical protein